MSAWSEASYTISEIKKMFEANQLSGLPPQPPEKATLYPDHNHIEIEFDYPKDILINSQIVCHTSRLRLLAKKDSVPEYDDESSIIFENNYGSEIPDTKSINLEDEIGSISEGQKYYFRFVTWSDHGMINKAADSKMVMSTTVRSPVFGYKINSNDQNPNTRIAYTNDNAAYKGSYYYNNDSKVGSIFKEWAHWNWIKKIKPYMVNRDGTADYALDPVDVRKKLDGTKSDVTNVDYQGAGAFVWIPKLYYKVKALGSANLDISLSESKIDNSYYPLGFIGKDGKEMEGVWFPMFYGIKYGGKSIGEEPDSKTTNVYYAVLGNVSSYDIVMNGLKAFDETGGHNAVVGTGIVPMLQMVFTMLTRSTDSQGTFGRGYLKQAAMPLTKTIGNWIVKPFSHQPGCYGNSGYDSPAMFLWSIVMVGHTYSVLDPYLIYRNRISSDDQSIPNSKDLFFSKNYIYEKTGVGYKYGKEYIAQDFENCIGEMVVRDTALGPYPTPENPGANFTSKYCDTLALRAKSNNTIPARFYDARYDAEPGIYTITSSVYSYDQIMDTKPNVDLRAAAPLGLPAPGYSPYDND